MTWCGDLDIFYLNSAVTERQTRNPNITVRTCYTRFTQILLYDTEFSKKIRQRKDNRKRKTWGPTRYMELVWPFSCIID